jgi:hypothetical protein
VLFGGFPQKHLRPSQGEEPRNSWNRDVVGSLQKLNSGTTGERWQWSITAIVGSATGWTETREEAQAQLVDGQLSFNGTRRGPRTWPADQVTAPSSVKSGIRLSHSSSATFSSMRARLDPMQR